MIPSSAVWRCSNPLQSGQKRSAPGNMTNLRRPLFLISTGGALAVLLAIAASFALVYKARADAARYLNVIIPLRIGTSYDVVVAQLRNAGIAVTLPDGCIRKCGITFSVDDRWVHRLHLAPLTRMLGILEFGNQKLLSKLTAIESDNMRAWAQEAYSLEPRKTLGFDSSGRLSGVIVYLPESDFSQNRTDAYAFNLSCIGSIKGCRADEYLPRSSSISLLNVTVHALDDENPQAEELAERLLRLPEIQGWFQEHGCVAQSYIVKAGIFTGGLPKPWGKFAVHVRDAPFSTVMAEVAAQSHTYDWYIEQGTERCTVDIGWAGVQPEVAAGPDHLR